MLLYWYRMIRDFRRWEQKRKKIENRYSDSRVLSTLAVMQVSSEYSRLQISKKKKWKEKIRGEERAKLLPSFVHRNAKWEEERGTMSMENIQYLKCNVRWVSHSLEGNSWRSGSVPYRILYLKQNTEKEVAEAGQLPGFFPSLFLFFYIVLVYAQLQLTAHCVRSDRCFVGF